MFAKNNSETKNKTKPKQPVVNLVKIISWMTYNRISLNQKEYYKIKTILFVSKKIHSSKKAREEPGIRVKSYWLVFTTQCELREGISLLKFFTECERYFNWIICKMCITTSYIFCCVFKQWCFISGICNNIPNYRCVNAQLRRMKSRFVIGSRAW